MFLSFRCDKNLPLFNCFANARQTVSAAGVQRMFAVASFPSTQPMKHIVEKKY